MPIDGFVADHIVSSSGKSIGKRPAICSGLHAWPSPLKRPSQNALAAIASCAKEKDFHNRTSML
jgi:hypothetical protein